VADQNDQAWGEKTARELVKTYPSLDAMVADAGAIKRTGAPLQRSASLRAGLQDAAGYLEKMDRVARIRTDLEVRAWAPEADETKLQELVERHRLGGPMRRLREAMAGVRSGPRGRSGSG